MEAFASSSRWTPTSWSMPMASLLRFRRSLLAAALFAVATATAAAAVQGSPARVADQLITTEAISAADGQTSDPSGEPLPRDDPPCWRQVFTDDFAQAVPLGQFPEAVSNAWRAYPPSWSDTTGFGRYSPHEVVSVGDGVLDLHIHSSASGRPLVAALVPKLPGTAKFGQLYGRYAIRFRSDTIAGYKVAWLLWPDSGISPRDGEIDFPE